MWKNSIFRKEEAESWKWMQRQDPEATEAVREWLKANPDIKASLRNPYYDNEDSYYSLFGFADLEQAENQTASYSPEAVLPDDLYNQLFEDPPPERVSFPIPQSPEEVIELDSDIAAAISKLTPLQREVLIRAVINNEPIKSIAAEKQQTTRNILKHKDRALSNIRKFTKDRRGSATPEAVAAVALISIIICLILWLLSYLFHGSSVLASLISSPFIPLK